MEKGVFIFGEITQDHLLLADEFPQKGWAPLLGELEMAGGSGLNTAVTLAGWKIPTLLAGNMIGQDSWGREIIRYLGEKGLSHRLIQDETIQTPRCICLVHNQQKTRSFLLAVKQVQKFHPRQIEQLDLSPFSHGFVDTYLGESAEKILDQMEKNRLWVLTQDLSVHSPYIGQTQGVQISVSSEDFQSDILGEKAKTYLRGKTQWVIFTGGERGAVAFHRKGAIWAKAHPANAVDTTGCGDGFRAGLFYGLCQGYPMEKALKIACWAGARTSEFLGSHGILAQPEDFL